MQRSTIVRIIVFALFIVILLSIIKHISEKPEGSTDNDGPDEIIIQAIKPPTKDIDITMYNHRTGELDDMSLEDYIIGVIAGEMPVSYEMEALKAQAVAARTLTVSQMRSLGGRGCSQHQGADVCSSYAHCQEWISNNTMVTNWGDNFDGNLDKVKQAVYSTRGEILKYQGEAIEVFYYSTSNGKTEDAGEVFSNSLPYYQVVDSRGEENAPRFYGSVTYTNEEFVNIFARNYKANLSASKLQDQIKIKSYTDSGRVQTISVGGVTMRSTEFRIIYGLNSTDFELSFGKTSVTINTKGFGHGVGMSQVGANMMAKEGSTYDEILKHYYRGISIDTY
ncbi:MAG TPA: stage II sporulation protein D [Bacillota bacterium]|nr:stage II sporulation protein D [Bacillota bacterium]